MQDRKLFLSCILYLTCVILPFKGGEHMNNEQLLSAISNILDQKLDQKLDQIGRAHV